MRAQRNVRLRASGDCHHGEAGPHSRPVAPCACGAPRTASTAGLIRILSNFGVELALQEIVRRLLPEEANAILAAGRNRREREAERAYAFCAGIERRYFSI